MVSLEDPEVYQRVKARLSSKKWRLSNLYYIKDKQGKKILFKPNYAQAKFLREKHNANIILKARQQGFTTLSCISYLDDCLFNSNLSAGIIAHNLEDANSFFTDKIKFAYDNLPEALRVVLPADTDRAGELRFNNGSSIRVRTSFRSGTLQRLHVSEFGKICARSPDKAKEIVTGALNAIASDQEVIIESTAEGKVGYFYDYCEIARKNERMGRPLGEMDFKFHFFAWHESPEYRTDSVNVVIPQDDERYFQELESGHGIVLSPEQKAWYVKKKNLMGEDMGREYPSHPDEAFAQSIDGSYYGKEMAIAESQGRIGKVPWEPMLKVHVSFDIGIGDDTTMWFFQVEPGGARRYIDYYANNGEGLLHYVNLMRSKPYMYGKYIFPHDIRVREFISGQTRVEKLEELGIRDIEIIPNMSVAEGVDAVRMILPKCYFDESKCSKGIEALKQYRKNWNDKAGVWDSKPLHDWTSHAADSFRMSALVDVAEIPMPTQRRANNKYR